MLLKAPAKPLAVSDDSTRPVTFSTTASLSTPTPCVTTVAPLAIACCTVVPRGG
jgi:hypothetical protein